MKTRKYKDVEYICVAEPDMEAVVRLTEDCKGEIRWSSFSNYIGIDNSKLYKLKKHTRITLPDMNMISAIVDQKQEESDVTQEDFLAFGGYLPKENLERIVYALQPCMDDVHDMRRREHTKKEFVHRDYWSDDHERFTEDILFACSYFDKTLIRRLRPMMDQIFADKAIVKMLYKFRIYRESDMNGSDQMANCYFQNLKKILNDFLDEKSHTLKLEDVKETEFSEIISENVEDHSQSGMDLQTDGFLTWI